MFTVKFIGVSGDDRHIEQFVSCQRFEFVESEYGAEIVIHKGMIDGDEDTSWRISKTHCKCHTHWTACFIENLAGKTIHAIRARDYKEHPCPVEAANATE